jgi:hypothetical protein
MTYQGKLFIPSHLRYQQITNQYRDLVWSVVQNEVVSFSTSDGSFPLYQSLCTRGPLGQQSEWILTRRIRTALRIPIKRSLDLSWLMWWISYL